MTTTGRGAAEPRLSIGASARGTNEISRIDDILTQTRFAEKPGSAVHTISTQDCHTDHNILCAEIPYLSIGQLPLPKIEAARMAPRTVLVSPMTKEDKQALRLAMAEQLDGQIDALWHDLVEEVGAHVLPHWETVDRLGEAGLKLPKWDSNEALQAMVDRFGNTVTDVLTQGHQIALQVCTTKQQGPHSPQHHQSRKIARLRSKYIGLRRRLRDLRYAGAPLLNTQQDDILVQMLKEKQSAADTAESLPEPEDQLRGELGKQVEAQITQTLKEIDAKDASYTVQRHRERQQKLADCNQKLGNKIMTGQHKPALKHALRVLKDDNKIITKPADVVAKCHKSLSEHHSPALAKQWNTGPSTRKGA